MPLSVLHLDTVLFPHDLQNLKLIENTLLKLSVIFHKAQIDIHNLNDYLDSAAIFRLVLDLKQKVG